MGCKFITFIVEMKNTLVTVSNATFHHLCFLTTINDGYSISCKNTIVMIFADILNILLVSSILL